VTYRGFCVRHRCSLAADRSDPGPDEAGHRAKWNDFTKKGLKEPSGLNRPVPRPDEEIPHYQLPWANEDNLRFSGVLRTLELFSSYALKETQK